MADPAIQYEDGGPDTSVPARSGLTGADTTGSLSPQRPTDFLGDLQARHDKVSGALAGEYGSYTHATSILDQTEQQRVERDRSRMDQAFALESAAASDPALNHPWQADKERSERIRGPLENFGSVGTIFALAASAFTRTPMTSALNAAGAAMTAMHQSDEEGYKSAYEAWKANSDLAIKRFNIERNLYEDANKLVSTDLGLWRQKRSMIAAQFDDRKRQIMLDAGMDAEVLKADEAFITAGEKSIDFQNKMEDVELTRNIAQEKMQEWSAAHPMPDVSTLPPQEQEKEKGRYALEQFKAKNQFMLEAKHQVAQSKSIARGLTPDQQLYDMISQKYEGDPDKAQKVADEYAAAIRNRKVAGGAGGAGSSTALTADRQHAADTQKIIDDEIKNGKLDANDPKAVATRRKEIESQYGGKPITGNERVKLESRVDKFKHSEETIDKTLKVLENHPASAGIAGKAMRLEERLTNIMGSKSTDRVQMMRDIELLRAWGQELLFSSRGKLKEEAQRIDSIVGGTSAGDTGPNTVRALRDLKKLYIEMQKEDQSRISGTWTGNTPAPTKPTSGKNPWDSDPLVGR